MKNITKELVDIKKDINQISYNLTAVINNMHMVETNLRNIFKIYNIEEEIIFDDD